MKNAILASTAAIVLFLSNGANAQPQYSNRYGQTPEFSRPNMRPDPGIQPTNKTTRTIPGESRITLHRFSDGVIVDPRTGKVTNNPNGAPVRNLTIPSNSAQARNFLYNYRIQTSKSVKSLSLLSIAIESYRNTLPMTEEEFMIFCTYFPAHCG